MSHDPIQCRDCGEEYDPGGSPHDCPGTARDQSERIYELEVRIKTMEQKYVELVKLLMMPAGPQRDGFREAARKLIADMEDESGS